MICAFCGNERDKNSGRTFHKFPKSDSRLLKQWLLNMGLKDYYPTANSVLCSDHFTEDCLDRTMFSNKLKHRSIPTKFDEPIYCCVYCKRKRTNSSPYSFFHFPLNDPDLLKQWVEKLGKAENWTPSSESLICSRHFADSSFRKRKDTYLSLKKDSYPTLFGENENEVATRDPKTTKFSIDISEASSSSEIMAEINAVEVLEGIDTNCNREETPPPSYSPEDIQKAVDHDHTYILSPEAMRQKYEMCQKKMKDQQQLLKKQQQKINQLSKKLTLEKKLRHDYFSKLLP